MIRNFLRRVYFLANRGTVLINEERRFVPSQLARVFNVRRNNVLEPAVIGYLRKKSLDGNVVIDIGANLGEFSLVACQKVGQTGEVYSFEPNLQVFGYLTEYLSKNSPQKNWYVSNAAVSDCVDLLQFSISYEDPFLMERSGLMSVDDHSEMTRVVSVSLDQLFSKKKVDLIKIDVEGAELQVLQGAEKLIENSLPEVIVEIHGLYFDRPQEHARAIFNFFEQKGYSAFNIIKDKPETMEGFISDSGIDVVDRVSNLPLSNACYGNISFSHSNKQN